MSSKLKHIGLILDGNRRWAKAHGLPQLKGHQKGYDSIKDIAQYAFKELGIEYVSAYIFSTENWNRSEKEVSYLMDLAQRMASRDLAELHRNNIKILWLGSRDKLSDSIKASIEKSEATTKDNTGGTLGICFNYGGQQEIVDAVKQIEGEVAIDSISQNLYAPEIPPVDLLIRTSGEQRISNFMLWRLAYAELLFVDKYWPDFTKEDLTSAIYDFNNRQRRMGA